ncbi:MAG: hypothetical protein ACREDO_12145 [Methyloceanibacter sp.]
MTFGEHVFLYCERGSNAALLAEPGNLLSNVGFLLAALVALQLVLWRPREEQSADHFLLAGLVFLIGLGSIAFHLYADESTALADVVPIGVFMLVYLGFALNRFLAVPPGLTVLLVIGMAALVMIAGQVHCGEGAVGFAGLGLEGAKPCLNGSAPYLPALGALIVVGLLLFERGHKAAPYVLWAAAIFTVSVMLRSLDMALCETVVIDGRKVGTHFLWHLLNALTLLLLLLASLKTGATVTVQAGTGTKTETAAEALPVATPVAPAPGEAKAGSLAAALKASTADEAAGKTAAKRDDGALAEAEEEEHEASEEEPEPEASEEEAEDEASEEEPEPAPKEKPEGKSKSKPFYPPA